MEKKNVGLVALLAGVAAFSSAAQANEVKPENPFVAEQKIQSGNNIVVAAGMIPCSQSDLLRMRRTGWTPLCN